MLGLFYTQVIRKHIAGLLTLIDDNDTSEQEAVTMQLKQGRDRCAYYKSDNTRETLIKYSRMGFKPIPLAVSSTNEIYNNPDYWTAEKLRQNYWRSSNIATTFGIIQTIHGNENDKLYLHCLDIDSDNVLAILFDLLKRDESIPNSL